MRARVLDTNGPAFFIFFSIHKYTPKHHYSIMRNRNNQRTILAAIPVHAPPSDEILTPRESQVHAMRAMPAMPSSTQASASSSTVPSTAGHHPPTTQGPQAVTPEYFIVKKPDELTISYRTKQTLLDELLLEKFRDECKQIIKNYKKACKVN